MAGAELLDHADVLARTQRRCEAEILLVPRQHAVVNDSDTVDPMQAKIPGGEQARRFGGDGTPLVAEFSPATLAARLGLSTSAGRELMADALDLAHRLPRLWDGVLFWARTRGVEVTVRDDRLCRSQRATVPATADERC